MIFSRGRGSGKHSRSRGARDDEQDLATAGPDTSADLDAGDDADDAGTPRVGPYDITEAPGSTDGMLDLGGLLIPVVDNVEVRVEADQEGEIRSVVLAHRNGALELAVFAAPRTAGIWDEVREDIRTALEADQVKATEVDGEYGTELKARVRTPGGPVDVRFVGIDGPRWMVRAVYQGRAASDPVAAAPLDTCLHGLVVNRGTAAMPVRDSIPLRLPRQAVESMAADGTIVETPIDGATGPTGINGGNLTG